VKTVKERAKHIGHDVAIVDYSGHSANWLIDYLPVDDCWILEALNTKKKFHIENCQGLSDHLVSDLREIQRFGGRKSYAFMAKKDIDILQSHRIIDGDVKKEIAKRKR